MCKTFVYKIKMEKLYKFPFNSFNQAIKYVITKNPARQKYLNILEMEAGHKPIFPEFSGKHPNDIFASTIMALKKALGGANTTERKAFEGFYLSDKYSIRGVSGIAEDLSCSTRQVYKMKKKVEEEFEKELIRRELIKPQIFDS